jgi:hypothetical protein
MGRYAGAISMDPDFAAIRVDHPDFHCPMGQIRLHFAGNLAGRIALGNDLND